MYNPVPKPKHKPQRRAVNNPLPTADDICTFPGCNRNYAHNHEIYFGNGKRQLSIEYGMQKRLCEEHHNRPGGYNPHHNRGYDLQLKREYQQRFEAEYSRELFVKVFGKNYLEG
jgi:hypothetical protein